MGMSHGCFGDATVVTVIAYCQFVSMHHIVMFNHLLKWGNLACSYITTGVCSGDSSNHGARSKWGSSASQSGGMSHPVL